MILRLSEATLGRLPDTVRRFRYERARTAAGVVHLGIGAFHRAHQAMVFDDLVANDPRWSVRAASLRSPAVRDAMSPQDGLYSLVLRDGADEQVRVIGAVSEVIVAPENPRGLIEALAAPETRLVTLTITEKGYLPEPDEARAQGSRGAAAYLATALGLRRDRGLAPFAVLSCDNLPHNGAVAAAAVLAEAERIDPRLRDWIAGQVAFPQTMVDRIVPATTKADVEALATRTGLVDEAMVKAEPYWQWVIEEFPGERPDFAAAGVQMTTDVGPWEDAKLRLLNGAHSAIAYLGGLAGVEYVDRFVAEPSGRRFVEAIWDEAAATLDPPPGLDVGAYRAALMARFANSALAHRTFQIAMDGSQKLPQRLLAPITRRLERDQGIEALALAVAGWIRWQGGRTDAGEAFTVDDPIAETTARLLGPHSDAAAQVDAILTLELFPDRLAADPRLRESLVRQLDRLQRLGARSAVETFAA